MGILWLLLALTGAVDVIRGGMSSLSMLQVSAALLTGFSVAVSLMYFTGVFRKKNLS